VFEEPRKGIKSWGEKAESALRQLPALVSHWMGSAPGIGGIQEGSIHQLIGWS